MTSGPATFSEVEDPGPAMFPAVDAPSTADLSTKIDAAAARTDTSISSAQDTADSARTVAIIAVVDRGGRDRPRGHRLAPRREERHRVNPFVAHASGADETMSLVMLFAGIWVGWIGWSRLRGTGFPRLPHWGAWATIGVAATLVITATFVPRMIVGTGIPSAARPARGRRRPRRFGSSIPTPARRSPVTT